MGGGRERSMKNALERLLWLVLVLTVDAAFWLLLYWALKAAQSLAMAALIAVLWLLYA